jgi:hypothetical protein
MRKFNPTAYETIIFILSVMILQACGPNYHLRRAQRHLKIAEQKGAIVENDTIWASIVRDSAIYDTVTVLPSLESLAFDTFNIELPRYSLKIKYDTITRTLFTEVKIPADTVLVPVEIRKTIKTGKSVWYYVPYFIAVLVIGFAVGFYARSRDGPVH